MSKTESSQKQKKRSIYQAVLFLAFFLLVITVATIIRLTILFTHASFDNVHRFTLGIIQSATAAQIVSFSPETQSISFVDIAGKNNAYELGKNLEVPVDSYVDDAGIKNGNISGFLTSILFRLDTLRHEGINQADVYKLLLFARGVKSSSVIYDHFHLPLDDVSSLRMQPLFVDHSIFQSGETIAIVNVSNMPGKGTALAKVLANIGGNVIAVSSGSPEAASGIYYKGKPTYTVEKIQKLLRMPLHKDAPPISDILIKIGKDQAVSTNF